MRRAVASLVLFAVAISCTGEVPPSADPTSPSPTPPEVTVPPDEPDPDPLPAPDEQIPEEARALAERLETTWLRLRAEIELWKSDGDQGRWPPPEEVELLALHEQRIYRVLARDERLASRVIERLPRPIATQARANVRARIALNTHLRPISGPITLRVRRPEPAGALRELFERAEERFGVGWEVLAAVMLIETRMGRVVSRSSAGAQGPMQFIPSTWEAYGMGGDVHDVGDAVMGAANYLRASGAPEDYRRALYHYNPLNSYVTAVLRYAKVMRRDPDAYYAYYNWQVFVRTEDGDVQLSGPGT